MSASRNAPEIDHISLAHRYMRGEQLTRDECGYIVMAFLAQREALTQTQAAHETLKLDMSRAIGVREVYLADRLAAQQPVIDAARAGLERVEGMCDGNHVCACGRNTGVAAVQSAARSALRDLRAAAPPEATDE